MTSFLQNVINFLQVAGLGTFGTNLFGYHYPASAPDKCLLVIDSGGPAPSKYLPVQEKLVQVLSRAKRYPEAEAKIRQVYELFHGKVENGKWQSRHNYRLGEYYVMESRAVQEPGSIGPDEKGRAELSVNFIFKIRPP